MRRFGRLCMSLIEYAYVSLINVSKILLKILRNTMSGVRMKLKVRCLIWQ